jgi:hypothetical protein
MFDLFSNKPKPAGAIPPPKNAPVFDVPDELPKLQAHTGAELAQAGGFPSPAGATDPANQSAAEFLRRALNERQEVLPVTKALAHHLPATEAVQWAVDSCRAVSDKLTPTDLAATGAAEAFLANPSDQTREAAAAAAARTDFQGPGAWAAKAASLAESPVVAALRASMGDDAAVPLAVKNPTAECVAGAVALAAGLAAGAVAATPPAASLATAGLPSAAAAATPTTSPSPDPAERLQAAKAFQPFITRGLQIAAGGR